MCKAGHQYNERPRALASLNSPLDLVCGRISKFSDFPLEIRALQEARTATEPAGEIRGGLQEELSHSDVGPKMTYKSGNCEKPLPHTF